MNRLATRSIVVLLSIVGAAAGAQNVHRCGDGRTYTDKPCDGAEQVDLRSNVLKGGPRFFPRYQPAPAVIAPDSTRQAAPSETGSAWERKMQRDAEHQSRTYRH
ncbi:MAG: hypothetical protein ACO1PB_19130 [Ramlibacter sp.]